ncbi:hypothetical protein AB0N17_04725 [Streptomyces sp. NPDC051133]|uniref:hypothetical protein n=1 Tax=Streptomyces sp. NPDC051133 TaxID=3155521 RepID=UPI00344650CE
MRSRAARRRGRRILLSTGAALAAALTAVTSGALDAPTKPTAPSPDQSHAPVQRVTVDLDAHTLTIEGRRFLIAAPVDFCPIGERTVTVTAKYPTVTLSRSKQRIGRAGPRKWAVTFTDRSHHQRLLLFALDPSDLPTLGKDAVLGAIGLAPAAGKGVYDAIRPEARVEIKGRQSESKLLDSACIDRQTIR